MTSFKIYDEADSIRVLHIDDDVDLLELTRLYLEEADPAFHVESVSSAIEGLKRVRGKFFECVVSDYLMAEMDGIQLCGEVRKGSNNIPFIIYTGHGCEEVAEKAFAIGVTDYIRKEREPSHYRVLAQRIRQAVEIHRLQQLYRTVVEDNLNAFAIIQGTTFRYVSRALANLLGVAKPEEIAGSDLRDWLPEEERDTVMERTLSRQRGESQPKYYYITVRRADGELKRVEVSASMISYRGKPASLVFNRDITERKQAEDALTLERTILKAVMENTEVMHAYFDTDFNFVAVNPAYANASGYKIEELIGKNHFDLFPNEENEAIFERVRDAGEPVRYYDKPFEYVYQPERGVTYWDWTLAPVKDKTGRVQGLALSLMETTPRKKAQDALSESEKRYRQLVESLNEGIWSVDRHGSTTFVNPRMADMLGYSADEMIGKNLFDFVNKQSADIARSIVEPYTNDLIKKHDFELLRKDGSSFYANFATSPINDEHGELTGALIAVMDISERKRMEEAARRERDNLINILNSMTDGVYIVNRKYDIEYENPALIREFGPVNGRKCYQYFFDRGEACTGCRIKQVFAGKTIRREWRSPKNQKTYDLISTPLRNSDGSVSNLELFRDITDRKRMESELKEYAKKLEKMVEERTKEIKTANERLKAFMDGAVNTFVILDKELRIMDVNKAGVQKFPKGTRKEDLIGKKMTEITPEIVEIDRYKGYKRVLETGTPYYTGYYKPNPMFGDKWWESWAFKVGDEIGIISSDVTERVNLEVEILQKSLEIERSRKLLSTFMESADAIFLIYDSKLNLMEVNKAGLELFPEGTTKKDVIGKNIRELVPGIENADEYRIHLDVIKSGKSTSIETHSFFGRYQDRQYKVRLFKVEEGMGVIATDITEQKSMERQILRVNQMEAVSRLAAMVAHDMRGPLSAIVQASSLAKNQPERTERMLKMIEENAYRSLRMIEEIRTNTGEMIVNVEETDLKALIENIIEDFNIPETIRTVTDFGAGLESVQLDPEKIRRILENLIQNGIESMTGGGTLTLRAEKVNDEVDIAVSDTGVGISGEDTPKIFDPFYTTKKRGLGLGLHYSKRAVEAHGGTITFKTRKGEGTTFYITLPAKPKKINQKSPAQNTEISG